MKTLEKETRPNAWRQRRETVPQEPEADYTRARTRREGVALSLADMNAYVNAWTMMDAARTRLFGEGLSPVVTVPSGKWLARAATATGQKLMRTREGQMVLSYRGLRFVAKRATEREGRA